MVAKAQNRTATSTNGQGENKPVEKSVVIAPLNMQTAVFKIIGTAPFVQNRFGNKAFEQMVDRQKAGQTARKGTKREPKDFDACYRDALHVSKEGWHGIHAGAFRNALISVCRLVNYKMTLAKLSIFIRADGYDERDGTPLVRITKGEPKMVLHPMPNDNGAMDIRARGWWEPGWEAVLRVRFDADQFTLADVANLLNRVGEQAGVGAGRPDSSNSAGCGWGTFQVESVPEKK